MRRASRARAPRRAWSESPSTGEARLPFFYNAADPNWGGRRCAARQRTAFNSVAVTTGDTALCRGLPCGRACGLGCRRGDDRACRPRPVRVGWRGRSAAYLAVRPPKAQPPPRHPVRDPSIRPLQRDGSRTYGAAQSAARHFTQAPRLGAQCCGRELYKLYPRPVLKAANAPPGADGPYYPAPPSGRHLADASILPRGRQRGEATWAAPQKTRHTPPWVSEMKAA